MIGQTTQSVSATRWGTQHAWMSITGWFRTME